MKEIYFCTDEKKLRFVYSEFITNDNIVYSEKDLGRNDFSDVEVIFSTWNMPVLTKSEISHYFPSLKAIFYAAGTIKYFATPYAELGVRIYNADQVNALPVAEFTVGEILLANKGYYQAQNLYRHLRFKKARKIAEAHPGNYRAKIGIVGAGRIGKSVIKLLAPYNFDIYVNDINLSKEEARTLNCSLESLEFIFSNCDVISNHLPDIPSTQKILNYDYFHLMKPYATFINTARGRQVDDNGLRKALKEERGRCAVLDVLRHEPIWPTNPLFCLSNVFITPHIAGSLNMEEKRMAEEMKRSYTAFLNGGNSIYEVKNFDFSTKA